MIRILVGDCRDVLASMPAASVHCVVTSPPYYGLRDYKVPPTIWGGDPACEHRWGGGLQRHKGGGHGAGSQLANGGRSIAEAQAETKKIDAGAFCAECGAWRGALGLEPDYRLYVEHMVEVFRAVWRVLRDDGTVWLNIGDSYATDAGKSRKPGGTSATAEGRIVDWDYRTRALRDGSHAGKHTAMAADVPMTQPNRMPQPGLKPKDLMGIPWRVAFALQDDGWWLRQEIIWHKPNPMPESIVDRCTKAHEQVFLLAKSEAYFFDADAIAEPAVRSDSGNLARKSRADFGGALNHPGRQDFAVPWSGSRRNKRSVWTVATEAFPEAHFATFPTALVVPCVLAGASERGCCPTCGAPWERSKSKPEGGKGWRQTCNCLEHEPVLCTVLDPFGGAGTVGRVADHLGREAVLVELNPEYADMARRRVAGLFTEVSTEPFDLPAPSVATSAANRENREGTDG